MGGGEKGVERNESNRRKGKIGQEKRKGEWREKKKGWERNESITGEREKWARKRYRGRGDGERRDGDK